MKRTVPLFLFLSAIFASSSQKVVVVADVVVLDDDNFEHLTQASTGQTTGKWFIKFYASWCAHCKSLAPKWREFSRELQQDYSEEGIVVAKLDAVANPITKERFGITGYPTLLYIVNGSVYKYQGPRQVDTLKQFVLGDYKKDDPIMSVPPPPSIVTQWRQKFQKLTKNNTHLKMLVDDFVHIVDYRKNAAVVLVVIGAMFGMLVGYLLARAPGNNKSPKQKKE